MKNTSRNILITGVSSGIGYSTTAEFLKRGYMVFGSVRKEADADRLTKEFGAEFRPLIFDVTDQSAVDKALAQVSQEIGWEGLGCLINNSGIAEGGPLLSQPMEDVIRHIDVNLIGLIRVTQAFLPLLGARENHPSAPGRILNISSVSGKFAYPFVAPYVASKHAVEGFSDSLRRELLLFGIDVIVIGPGSVQTPIWDKGMVDLAQYESSPYAKILKRYARGMDKLAASGLTPEYLARKIVDVHETKKPKTRYAFVKGAFTNWILPRLLPDRMMDGMIKKQLGL